jgi:hypothetical protein
MKPETGAYQIAFPSLQGRGFRAISSVFGRQGVVAGLVCQQPFFSSLHVSLLRLQTHSHTATTPTHPASCLFTGYPRVIAPPTAHSLVDKAVFGCLAPQQQPHPASRSPTRLNSTFPSPKKSPTPRLTNDATTNKIPSVLLPRQPFTMSLKAKYQDFLGNPTTGALAPNAALTYIPTLTAIHEPTAILKHYAAQAKQIKKKGDKILSAINGPNGLAVETETTLEFISGGGAYLPGLDDNFLADKTVIFPIVSCLEINDGS